MDELEQAASPTETPSDDERTWAMFAHLSALSGLVTGGVGCVVGPLIVWLVKRDTMPFVADQGKEALNFNITLALAFCVLALLVIFTFGLGLLLAWPIGAILCIGWFVLTVVAMLKARDGVRWRYPVSLRLVN